MDLNAEAQEPPDATPDVGGIVRPAGFGGVTFAYSLEAQEPSDARSPKIASVASEPVTLVGELFDAAMDLPVAERERYLERSPANSGALREVRRLLAVAAAAGDFFDKLGDEIRPARNQPPRLEPGYVLNRKFRILRFVARGGMGEVYEAEHLIRGGRVALKVMTEARELAPGSFESFRDEINLAISVNHPNVCRVHDVDRAADPAGGDLVYFTMEFLDGRTLADILTESGPLPLDEVRPIVRQMASGLHAAHQAGILHRDFKSGNVMICGPAEKGAESRVVITDFGLSWSMKSNEANAPVSGATRGYASIEQLNGLEETEASDIFSFGAVLYEMVTGELPFDYEDRSAGVPVSPTRLRPDLPQKWETTILRCLEADPPKRYRSVLKVAEDLGCGTTARRLSPWWLAAVAALMIMAAGISAKWNGTAVLPPSVAVLPFDADTDDNRFIADGIADRLTDSLSQVPGLRTVARPAAQRLKDPGRHFAEAAKTFRVRYLLIGSVKARADRLHVTTEFVEAATGSDIWSGTEDLSPQELDTLEATVTRAAIQKLQLTVPPSQLASMDGPPTRNAEAYRDLLLGRYYAARRSRESLRESVDVLERAVRLDPAFSAAYAALAYSYNDLSIRSAGEWREPARRSAEAAQTAVRLNPNSATGYLVIALNKFLWDWDWDGAETYFKHSLALNPYSVDAHRMYGNLLSRRTRHPEALQQLSMARDLDPLSSAVRVAHATALLYAGETAKSLEAYREVIRTDPGYQNVYIPMSDALERSGLLSEAIQACEKGVALTGREGYAISSLARLYGLAGRREEAQAILTELSTLYANGAATPTEIAYVYLGLGDKEKAFDWIEKGIPQRNINLTMLKAGPEFEVLRTDSRYTSLLARMGL
jgi:serine/threonine-protein kinase